MHSHLQCANNNNSIRFSFKLCLSQYNEYFKWKTMKILLCIPSEAEYITYGVSLCSTVSYYLFDKEHLPKISGLSPLYM